MKFMLEHANITVKNIDEAVRFLTTAFPDFKIRGGGVHNGNRWVHVGTHETYIALNEGAQRAKSDAYETSGINHLGYVVDDAEAVKQRLLKAGFKEGFVPPEHPHRRRVYLFDSDGFEWEFVQYYSENLAERNDYTQ